MSAVLHTAEIADWITGIIASDSRARVLVEIGKLEVGQYESLEICGFGLQSLLVKDEHRSRLYFRKSDTELMLLAVDDSSSNRSRKFSFASDVGSGLAHFDPVKYLDDETTIISYLIESQATHSSELRLLAFRNASRARVLNQLAIQAGITRAETYDFLKSKDSIPIGSVTKLLSALKDHRMVPAG